MILQLLLVFAADIAGSWTGDSICTGVRAACKDEHVIWTFQPPDSRDKVQMSADKVVNGERQNMGTGEMQLDRKASTLLWKIPLGEWKLAIKDDTIKGTLTL